MSFTPEEIAIIEKAFDDAIAKSPTLQIHLEGALRDIRGKTEHVQQEPVGEVDIHMDFLRINWKDGRHPPKGTKLYAAPVRTKDLTDDEKLELARSSIGKSRHWLVEAAIAAYEDKNMFRNKSNWEEGYEKAFAPVRTKDLTDGAIWEILETYPTDILKAMRAVIAADREKNK